METSEGSVLYWMVIAAIVIPVFPLAAAWYRWFASCRPNVRMRTFVIVSMASLSYVFLVFGIAYPDVLGPDYGHRRYLSIYVNLGAMFLLTVVAAGTRPRSRTIVALFGYLTLLWAYMAAVNALL